MKRWHAMALGALGLWLFLGLLALIAWLIALGKFGFLLVGALLITLVGALMGAEAWKEDVGEVYGPGDDGS